ncbi:Polyketide cyclase / dehydrase and lipid transport [Halogranum amylolyticum]|uniref:Polyketide cyclase / dehydrase and lipid transport n=1 Tax=Halogranum amylolyticum TaxID=660520 RepID=A0A1H8R4B1_9EURY|nr:SRPBCC family protein [Halogranum amylolyticum]SEO61230.1 Polyketide cyclase / dehydrase and lipid transport [Halogranum amylolyticum]
MREVEVSRFVRVTPAEVERALTPAAVVEYEGSFSVVDVADRADGSTVVTAGSRGLTLSLRFEEHEDGLYYTQEGDAGPFDAMETWVTVRPEDDGSRVTMRSAVSLGLPLSGVTDRLAAWKRRGELERALDALATDLG